MIKDFRKLLRKITLMVGCMSLMWATITNRNAIGKFILFEKRVHG